MTEVLEKLLRDLASDFGIEFVRETLKRYDNAHSSTSLALNSEQRSQLLEIAKNIELDQPVTVRPDKYSFRYGPTMSKAEIVQLLRSNQWFHNDDDSYYVMEQLKEYEGPFTITQLLNYLDADTRVRIGNGLNAEDVHNVPTLLMITEGELKTPGLFGPIGPSTAGSLIGTLKELNVELRRTR